MTEGDSIKITKADTLPESYYGSSGDEIKLKEYVKLYESDEKKCFDIKIKKNKTEYFNKLILKGKNGIKTVSAAVFSISGFLNCCRKDAAEKICEIVKAGVKKISLNFAVSMAMLLLTLIFTACFCSLSYKVTLGGAELGVLDKKSDFAALVSEINSELAPYGEVTFTPEGEPKFTPELILKGAATDKGEFKERLKSTSTAMIPAYSITVDNIPVFALASAELAKEVLTEYGEKCTEGMENAEITFLNDVKISHIFVPKTMLKSKETAVSALLGGKHIHYTANENDTLEGIAEANGISLETLLLSNTVSDSENLAGTELEIFTGEPVIEYKTVEHINKVLAIPRETKTENDDTKYAGTIDIKVEGSDGEKQVEAFVTTINGIETERDIISEIILSEPVSRVEIIGTKEKPSPYGTGEFVTPAFGQISSRYGSRWGRNHDGIDVAANEGTPIYAADNGTVIYSQYNDGGYGYLIEIDHKNGYVTYYAHCSKLVAKEGDVVAKGDLIGYVGNTGRSTGAHLHFEVRKNGEPCDPMTFLER